MARFFLAFALLLAAVLPAQAQFGSPSFLTQVIAASAPASYVGPGDVAAAPIWASTSRAYNAASIGMPVIDVTCSASNFTINSVAGGSVDNTTLATDCPSGGSVTAVYAYGTGVTGGTTKFTAASGHQAAITTNAVNGRTCMTWNSATLYTLNANLATVAQPWNMTLFYELTTRPASSTNTLGDSNGGSGGDAFVSSTANTVDLYAGADVTKTGVTDSAFHRFQLISNGASGSITVDGSTTTSQNSGGNSYGSGTAPTFGITASGPALVWCEGEVLATGSFNSTLDANVSAWY